jgi:hypothetical protein
MKHILSFDTYSLNEGVNQFNVVRNMEKIALKYFEDYYEKTRHPEKKFITYNSLFNDYKNDPILSEFLNKLKVVMGKEKKSAGIMVHYTSPFSLSRLQQGGGKILGGFDAKDTLNIFVFEYGEINTNLKHELSHLYDYVMAKFNGYDNTDSYIEHGEDPIDYFTQEFEVRARFFGFVNDNNILLDDFEELSARMVRKVKIDGEKIERKYIKLLYKIWAAAKENSLPSVTLIEKERKVIQRLSTLEKLEQESRKYNLSVDVDSSDPKHYTLRPDVLSVLSVENGEVSYPILEKYLHFFHKNMQMRITILGISLVRVIKEKYNLTVLRNDSNYRTKDNSWHIKRRKLKTDKIADVAEEIKRSVNRIARDLYEQFSVGYVIDDKYIERFQKKAGIVETDMDTTFMVIAKLLEIRASKQQEIQNNIDKYRGNEAYKMGIIFLKDIYEKYDLARLDYPTYQLHFRDMDLYFVNCLDFAYVKRELKIE